MAPAASKKRPMEDDFIMTIDDDEPLAFNEETEISAAPPKKKSKKDDKKQPKIKKTKKSRADDRESSDDEDKDEEATLGIWGKNDEDDGAMDPGFEFMADGLDEISDDEFRGWDLASAKKSAAEKKGADLGDIIRRRLEKKKQNGAQEVTEDEVQVDEEEEEDSEEEDSEEEVDLDLDDDEDQALADDAFGMTALEPLADDEDEDDEDQENDEENEDEDEEKDKTYGNDQGDDSDAQDDDAEEEERRKAFFAPEEPKDADKTAYATFQTMSLSRPILRGLSSVGFTKPTPIQAQTIPVALMGKDVVGGAVTGSGKTGAFIVPILERLLYRPKKVPTTRVVVLTPTRELAIQCHAVATKLSAYTDIKFTLTVGGLSLKAQEAELRRRPDVIIATPGRFIDHMRNSPSFAVDTVEILVLDEADRMLEDGFADELNEILTTLPKTRQTMLFSATMTTNVDRLIRAGLDKPVRLMVDTQNKTASKLTQEFVRIRPGREDKRMGYLMWLCKNLYHERVIIFFRQKRDAHRARIVMSLLGLSCAELHGSMNQTQRIENVESFRDGKVSYMVATDLASRGLDIKGIDTVINYEAPQNVEIYVHRVGRTARAGRSGVACTLAAEPDRKVVKAAVKSGKAQGAKIVSRAVGAAEADEWQAKVDELADEIDEILEEEKTEKQLAQAEMEVKKGENMMEHEDAIKARPRRTWFETERDKKAAKEAGRAELNGLKESLKKKNNGKLSNKDKKKLDAHSERKDGGADKVWKKGRAERDGRGAVLNLKEGRRARPAPGSKGGFVKSAKKSRR